MPVVFKIYIDGIQDDYNHLVFQSNQVTGLMQYGDSVISSKLKKETNKADSLEFTMLPSNEKYNSFEKKKTFVYMTRDGKCIFRGRVSDVKTDIYEQRTITCEGDLAFLADSVQPPNKKTVTQQAGNTSKKKRAVMFTVNGSSSSSEDTIKMTPANYFRSLISEHNNQVSGYNKNFSIGTINVTGSNNTETFERTSFQDTSSVISSDLLSVYGGILRTRYENNTAYIDWLDSYTTNGSQDIQFGVNMIDLDQEPPGDDVWSVLLPVGDDNLTIADVNNGSKYLVNNNAVDKYGYIVHYHHFTNVKKAGKLKTKAQKYLDIHCKIYPDNYIVKAIDLQLIGESNAPLELGSKIRVLSSPHGINDKTMACIAMELDIFNPENNSYTIGTILPPDKEKKKEPISSKLASSHQAHSRGIGSNANAIAALGEDVNVNSNNINVNAQNIAVNAQNIAVNAENIAVVAKNIAIAAETIDIKAQSITATFTEETGTLEGSIEASAAGIKTAFSDSTTGLSSYFQQTANSIIAGVESADGNIRNKIELTENGLKQEFNKKLYGEGGQGGLVADYEHKIETSASGTKEYFETTLYGEGGTSENPTATSFYSRVKEDTAAESIDTFHSEIYGGAGYDSTNPKTGTFFDAVYTKSSQMNQSYFTKTMYGDGGSVSNPKDGSVLSGVYSQSASAWSNVLWGTGTKDNPAVGSILYGTNQEIGARVKQGDVENGFKITTTGIKLFAKEISLEGYVTVDKLSAVDGNITNLVNGTTIATTIKATNLKAVTGKLEIGDTTNNKTKLYYHGTEYYSTVISMPGISGTNSVLGWHYLNSKYDGTIDLSHSHSCTTNTDGTITLGGTVAAGKGGSFKIADTKAYKDGVSAAKNSVGIFWLGKNTRDYTNSVGDAEKDKTVAWYNSSTKEFNIHLRAVADNEDEDNRKEMKVLISIPGNKAYTAGANSVGIYSVGKNLDNRTDTVGDTNTDATVAYYDADEKKFYIRVKAVAENPDTNNRKHREDTINIPGDKAYNKGDSDGYTRGYSKGKSDGYTEGKSDGYTEGYSKGKSDGYTEGRKSVNLNDVTVSSVTYHSSTSGDYASVSIDLPNASGTKNCYNVSGYVIDIPDV